MVKKETVLSIVKEQRDLLTELIKHFPISALKKPLCNKDGRFIRNSDGTVIDNYLKLTWYPTLNKKMPWEKAKKECKKLGYRLPTVHELFSLVDITKYNPAIDKKTFPDTKIDEWYWTGDTCPWDSGYARIVLFNDGSVYGSNKDNGNVVRPVRSSQ